MAVHLSSPLKGRGTISKGLEERTSEEAGLVKAPYPLPEGEGKSRSNNP